MTFWNCNKTNLVLGALNCLVVKTVRFFICELHTIFSLSQNPCRMLWTKQFVYAMLKSYLRTFLCIAYNVLFKDKIRSEDSLERDSIFSFWEKKLKQPRWSPAGWRPAEASMKRQPIRRIFGSMAFHGQWNLLFSWESLSKGDLLRRDCTFRLPFEIGFLWWMDLTSNLYKVFFPFSPPFFFFPSFFDNYIYLCILLLEGYQFQIE